MVLFRRIQVPLAGNDLFLSVALVFERPYRCSLSLSYDAFYSFLPSSLSPDALPRSSSTVSGTIGCLFEGAILYELKDLTKEETSDRQDDAMRATMAILYGRKNRNVSPELPQKQARESIQALSGIFGNDSPT